MMINLKHISITVIALLFAIVSAYSHTKNYEPILAKTSLEKMPECVGYSDFNYEKLYGKVSKNKLQAVEFFVFDSLANSLSYHTRSTTPFIWDPEFDILATIKRGSFNPDEIGVDASNTKNNIFLRMSSDMGNTWDPNAYILYNELQDQYGGARYPSLSSFKYNNEIAFGYTSSLVFEAAGTWNGYLTGFFSTKDGSANIIDNKAIVNGTSYDWGVSDAGVTSGTLGNGNLYIFAVDALTPTAGGSLTDNGNIGYRKTIELDPAKIDIPSAWRSSKFYPVDSVVYRPNELIGLRKREDGVLYLGVTGNFVVTPEHKSVKIGFSTSTDNGDTWSDFEIMPPQLLRDYATSLGLDPDSCSMGYYSKDFTVLKNGDVYFATYFFETNAAKDYAYNMHQIIVIKFEAETKNWSVTKIADVNGLWVNYLDDTGASVASGVDVEVELAKTLDEKNIVLKYIDLVGVNWTDPDHYTYTTSDIFISTYSVGSSSWAAPVNITESAILERDTHMPEIIPNTLQNIPILMLHTILLPGEESGSAYFTAARSYLRKQHVAIGHFNPVVSVEDNNTSNITKFNRVFPNPANDNTTIDFNTVGDGNLQIFVTDLLGNVVSNVYNGFVNGGTHSFNINTAKFQNGTYYIVLKDANKTMTEVLNIIR
jgi:hypothetical protein